MRQRRPGSRRAPVDSPNFMPVRRPRRGLAVAACAAVLAAYFLSGGAGGDPAQAAPGDVTITGHGYGHGRGLSQWGAYGFATRAGWSSEQILTHYYSNTSTGNIGNPLISVRITGLDNIATQVTSKAAFTVGGTALPAGVVAQVKRNADGSWQLSTLNGCHGAVTGSTRLTSAEIAINTIAAPGDDITKMLTVCHTARTYRGTLTLLYGGGAVRTVNTLPVQDYLRGVVPREVPASWGDAAGGAGLQALMAQTVAARSYAWAETRATYAKTCDTTACQVYGGAGLNGTRIEDGRTDLAIFNTGGQVRMLGGAVARTEFSSSSGGYTAGGTFPAVRDEGDLVASPYATWSPPVTVAGATVSSAFGVGTLRSITVLSRNGLGADGGRVTKVRVIGSVKSVDVTGNEFRSALGLKSDWFTPGPVEPPPPPPLKDISPVGVSAVRTSAGSVIAFVRGTNGSVYYTTSVGGSFGAFRELPGRIRNAPAAVSSDGSRIDVFVVGTDQALWQATATVDGAGQVAGFGAWQSLGGVLTSAPGVAANAAGNMIVSARGTDGALFARAYQGGSWQPWQSAGGAADSAPALAVVDASTTRLQVVGSDGTIWTRDLAAATGGPVAGWAGTGRTSRFAPAVSDNTSSMLGVRALGVSNGAGVRQIWGDGRVVELGGSVTSAIAIIEEGVSQTWTFARGSDGALWFNRVTDPAAPGRWAKIGGQLA